MARRSEIKTGVYRALPHDSAEKHVSGEAHYIDDLPEPPGLLHAAFGLSERPHARIKSLDLGPVRAAAGVLAVIAAGDVPGENNCAPVMHDDPIFADGLVEYVGQSIFAVAAQSVEQARRAAHLAVIDYKDLPAILTIKAAMAAKSFVLPAYKMKRGDAQ